MNTELWAYGYYKSECRRLLHDMENSYKLSMCWHLIVYFFRLLSYKVNDVNHIFSLGYLSINQGFLMVYMPGSMPVAKDNKK